MTAKKKKRRAKKPPHGGKRPGSGRKCLIPGKTKRKTIHLTPSAANYVHTRARKRTRSRGHTVTDSDMIEEFIQIERTRERKERER